MSRAAAAPTPPGVLAYVSDTDYYGSSSKEALVTVLPDGTGKRTLLPPASVAFGLLAFSPTGQQIAYFLDSSSGVGIDVMDVATRHEVRVLLLRGTSAYVDGLAWTPNSRDLIVGTDERPGTSSVHPETALWKLPVSGGRRTRLTPYEDAGDPASLPDGDLVYVVSKTFSSGSLKKSALWLSGPDGSHPERILRSSDFVDGPAAAPDGRAVAFSVVVDDTTSYLESLTLATRRRATLTPLVKGRTDISPSWSPDGSEIVFLSSRAGRYATTKSDQLLDAYVMRATGASPKKAIARKGDKWSLLLVAWGPLSR